MPSEGCGELVDELGSGMSVNVVGRSGEGRSRNARLRLQLSANARDDCGKESSA